MIIMMIMQQITSFHNWMMISFYAYKGNSDLGYLFWMNGVSIKLYLSGFYISMDSKSLKCITLMSSHVIKHDKFAMNIS